MNNLKLFLLLFCCTIILSCSKKPTENQQSVNVVIGDISYNSNFGSSPDDYATEDLRIQTHLKYVEEVLRSKNTENLTEEQKENRLKMLNLLNEYWSNGVFPRNYDYPDQRIPCFIDKNGKICAVGYLIEKTAGREIAEAINSKFKYEYLLEMKDQVIDNWIEESGLTKIECAMIQPTYGPPITSSGNYLTPKYALSSSVFSGVNISLSTMNIIQSSKGVNSKAVPIVGLITGATQITLGAINYPEEVSMINGTFVNTAQRNVSMINIGLGTTTMLLSTYNLITNRTPKVKSYSWNLYSFPTYTNNAGLGLSYTKRL